MGRADRIIVLDAGVIVGHGTHAHLLRGCDTYRNLVSGYAGEDGMETHEQPRPSLVVSAT
jgi:ABC-type transport system involved in cytochrome bd biosynthesis fused ATPase/permease subunit